MPEIEDLTLDVALTGAELIPFQETAGATKHTTATAIAALGGGASNDFTHTFLLMGG